MLRTDYAHIPQRCVYVMPCGSNIDVARCGWDDHMMSNSRNGGAISIAHHLMSATKVAPPKIQRFFVAASAAKAAR
ncbi:MAG: hypothetical protein K2N54_01480 [Helicobacter sp.]|nr:hypothetical protein [Helicobacter sp.]